MSRPVKPPLSQDLVEAIVKAAHRDLDAVAALLDQEPALANACWDRGGGDWETPLGGAAHTGQQAIARLLLARGARLDMFCAAMLGLRTVVEAALAAEPAVARSRGPHGISLAAHARAGGHEELAVYIEARAEEAGAP